MRLSTAAVRGGWVRGRLLLEQPRPRRGCRPPHPAHPRLQDALDGGPGAGGTGSGGRSGGGGACRWALGRAGERGQLGKPDWGRARKISETPDGRGIFTKVLSVNSTYFRPSAGSPASRRAHGAQLACAPSRPRTAVPCARCGTRIGLIPPPFAVVIPPPPSRQCPGAPDCHPASLRARLRR